MGEVLVSDQHGVGGADVLLVVVDADNLHVVQAELNLDTLVGGAQEAEGVEGELKLRTDPDEDAALGLESFLPAELEGHDVLVLVRLGTHSLFTGIIIMEREGRTCSKGPGIIRGRCCQD